MAKQSGKARQTGKGTRGRRPQAGAQCHRSGRTIYHTRREAELASPRGKAKQCGSGQHWHAVE